MANDFFPTATHLSGLLAAVLSRLGRAEEGLRIVDEFRLDPEGVRCGELEYFHYHAGRSEALFALGDHEQALDYAEKALAHGTSINNQCLMTQGAGLLADLHLELDPACAIGLKMRDLQLSLSKKYGLAKSMRPPLKVSEAQ